MPKEVNSEGKMSEALDDAEEDEPWPGSAEAELAGDGEGEAVSAAAAIGWCSARQKRARRTSGRARLCARLAFTVEGPSDELVGGGREEEEVEGAGFNMWMRLSFTWVTQAIVWMVW